MVVSAYLYKFYVCHSPPKRPIGGPAPMLQMLLTNFLKNICVSVFLMNFKVYRF